MVKTATLILTDEEIRDELSLDADSISVEQCNELNQFASDQILMVTGYDFGQINNSTAKMAARTIIYQKFFRTKDQYEVVNCLLATLQDVARQIKSEVTK